MSASPLIRIRAPRWLARFLVAAGAQDGTPAASPPGHHPPDRIITWSEVRAGDVVLQDDCLIVAERVQIHQSPWGDGTMFPKVDVFHRLDNGVLVSSEHHGDRFTAVLGHRRADQVRTDR